MPKKDEKAMSAPEQELTEETAETELTAEEEVEKEQTPEERIALLEEALKEAAADKLRAIAEVENIKKRLDREKEEFLKYAKESVICDLLPVLDNLDLALAHSGDDDVCKNFVIGVDMTRKIFLDTLAKHDLKPVGEPGEQFDPAFAEAVGIDENADDDVITQVVQKGYMLKERVIRPAKVIVGKKG